MKSSYLLAALTFLFAPCSVLAGPFAPAAGLSGSEALAANDPAIKAWAVAASQYSAGTDVDTQFQDVNKAVGPAGNSNGSNAGYTFDIVSLGRGGSITLTFAQPIANGNGFDFAVFENSFSDGFLELAWVEVSSDGINFTRFSGYSLTPNPIGPFSSTVDPTNIEGLAGKYRGGFGTPFDLALLEAAPLLDINAVTHVRLVDIVGDGSQQDNFGSPLGPNPIYDPYPTSGSAGFDLDAIAVLHPMPEVVSENVPIPFGALLMLGALLTLLVSQRPTQPNNPATQQPNKLSN